ncbi:HPF/RaiA family ribosome-associated protein [Winogradskyella aurantia]|uniref:30S ribosomal protein S30 n=1 Tax=Winogradskyella aurantia TaxID=1915063 RepID=A0A265UT20_9FLAO|nr:HPF/RaiA family ribosome-associated protein [Winogradskyella aurantia]OZV68465.1 30S ribosomal protein S30 [Winogradskyella aurantia]
MKTILFKYDGVSSSESLETYAKEKIEKLFTRNDFLVRADVFFKTENTSNTDTGMIAAIRLSAPGPRLYAEASKSNFRAALSECVDQLRQQLAKRTEILKSY